MQHSVLVTLDVEWAPTVLTFECSLSVSSICVHRSHVSTLLHNPRADWVDPSCAMPSLCSASLSRESLDYAVLGMLCDISCHSYSES